MTYNAPEIVDILKSMYPNPCESSPENLPGSYCVGGTVLMFLGKPPNGESHNWFPTSDWLVCHIQELVGYEGEVPAEIYRKARRVVKYNDAGNFSAAWVTLQELINDAKALAEAA